jgi:uncharacterized membrane protein
MSNDQGSIDGALAGSYDFSIGGVLDEAWERVHGAKLTFVGSAFVYVVVAVFITGLLSFFIDSQAYYAAGKNVEGLLADIVIGWLALPVTLPLLVGIIFLGIRRSCGYELSIASIFDYYILVWPLVFTSILINILTYLGFLLFILPGIYLAVAYMFALPLLVDKKMGIWEAMELSRRAVSKHWFKIFAINIVMLFIILISAIPLGIGLIWTFPLAFIVQGTLYRKIFGYEAAQ